MATSWKQYMWKQYMESVAISISNAFGAGNAMTGKDIIVDNFDF